VAKYVASVQRILTTDFTFESWEIPAGYDEFEWAAEIASATPLEEWDSTTPLVDVWG
jgi:hypothetical protein